MRLYNNNLKTICLFSLCSLTVFGTSSSALAENGWILTQHSQIFGDQYLYISPHGVKCISPRHGIGWITVSPTWHITFFNEKTKLYYSISGTSLRTKMAKSGFVPGNITWSKVSTSTIAGLKASQYKMVNSSAATNVKNKWRQANYWLADNINVPPSLAQLISSAYALPASDAIPLQLSYQNSKGINQTVLTTYHQQKVDIPDTYFSFPSGYKLAKSETDVLISQENKALIDELADDLNTPEGQKKINPQLLNAAKNIPPESVNKLPAQVQLPGGRNITKEQISKFINKLKEGN